MRLAYLGVLLPQPPVAFVREEANEMCRPVGALEAPAEKGGARTLSLLLLIISLLSRPSLALTLHTVLLCLLPTLASSPGFWGKLALVSLSPASVSPPLLPALQLSGPSAFPLKPPPS